MNDKVVMEKINFIIIGTEQSQYICQTSQMTVSLRLVTTIFNRKLSIIHNSLDLCKFGKIHLYLTWTTKSCQIQLGGYVN